MINSCVTTYGRRIWYALYCERWASLPTSTLSIEFFETEEEAKKHSKNIGVLTISSDSKIHIAEIDE